MTRIIQRCLLVLAFTGVVLSSSQETTVSDVSDPTAKSSEQTSPSAPESSSYSVEKYSSYSPIDKTEDHSPSTSAVSSSKQEASVASTALNDVDNDIVSENANSKDGTTATVVLESTTRSVVDATGNSNNADRSTTVQSTTFVSATEETLAKVELQEAEPKDNLIYNKTLEKTLNSSDKDVNSSANSPNRMHEQDVSDVGLSDIGSQPTTSTEVNEASSATTIVSELKETTVTAVSNPAEINSSDNITSDYGQSSVPSVEESVYNTSYVDKYHTSEKMFSTTPSKVQTVDSKASDLPKSATRKRSLNATNTASSNASSVSTMRVTTPLSPSEFSTQVTEIMPVKSINKNSGAILETDMKVQLSSTVLPSTDFVNKKSETVTHPEETGESSSPYTVNNVVQNVNDNAAQNGKDELDQHVPKTSSASSLDVTHMSSTSSIALSTANGESIHSLETTIDHVSHLGISSMPPTTVRTHEKLIEREDEFPTISSGSPLKHSSPVTFDPNGMTHNYTQDPDSITFTPETFYVDGMPANGYLSRLEENEFTSNKPVVDLQHAKLEESTTHNDKLLGSSSSESEINTPEREREYVSPSGINLSPHDEPDLEEMSDRHTPPNTKKETENQFSKDGSLQTQTGLPVQTKKPLTHLPNDESEEMLNDSPYFDQSNFASASSTEVKSEEIAHALNKALEMNVSNDISPSTGSNSQNTPETANELEFPVDYQTAQSEIRPVTVVSPLQTSDSTIFSPVPIKVETHLQPEVTKSEQPDTTLPNTSSPIILPNPAPSIADIRAKATTMELPPHLLPPGYVHEPKKENENVAPKISSIDVANLRTKVTAVEMPSHLLPPGYTPEPENGGGSSKDSPTGIASLRPTAIEMPSHLLPPGYTPEPESGSSKDLRPNVTAIEMPSHLLPPGYTPEPENGSGSLKDSPTGITNLRPTAIEMPSHLLPPGYKPEPETENEASKNSTIAGVAVQTSISVSLPLSKGTNISMSSTEDKTYDPSGAGENSSVLPVPINVPGGRPSISASTETSAGSTTGLKIRKPKLKIGGTEEPATPRTRKPFLSSFQRPSTTAGPPVSIFNKARTRSNSITSSTTAKPFPQFSTMLIHYASRMPGMMPNGFSFEPTTEVPTTTETEEPFSDEPFNEPTQVPIVSSEDDVTLIRVAGYIVVEKGLKWIDQLNIRHSQQYKDRANFVHLQLERLFRSSPIAPSLWKIQIDGFSAIKSTRSVAVDFFLYLIKSKKDIPAEQLVTVFHDKLKNNTFSRFTVDTSKTTFEVVNEEPLKTTTPPPEKERETFLPQWAIAVIVVGAASLIFIILFAAVAILGRHHMRRRYSNKLNDEDSDRPSDWESKMAAAYENLAADTTYDAEDLHSDSYKKSYLVD